MPTNLSIQQKIAKFSEAAESLADDVSQAELDELGKDIGKHAGEIWAFHKLLEADAERLAERAREFSDAARTQNNKAQRVKTYLKFALKSNNFTKAKFGDVQMALSESRKAVAKRPAYESDFYAYADLVRVKFNWSKPPSFQLWEELPDFVMPEFEWDLKKLKDAGREDMIDYETTTRLSVKIAKAD